MKRIVKLIVVLIGIVLVFICSSKENKDIRTLVFENMEALAQNEGQDRDYCIGNGSIDCHGYKVKYMASSLR